MKTLLAIILISTMVACSSTPRRERVFLDSSTHEDSPPAWVKSTKTVWENDKKLFLKASHQVLGNERVSGCMDLAKLDSKEGLLSEIANDVKGVLDNASQSISENAEVVLGKVRSGEFEGKIVGLRFTEEYWERYQIGETERVDCYVLGEMKPSDYAETKRFVVNKLQTVDARLREAITRHQIDFFKPTDRETASIPSAPPEARTTVSPN